jgi:hypothetical protein
VVHRLSLASVSLLLIGACGGDPIKDTVDRTTAAFDDAIKHIQDESISWRTTLETLASTLTEQTQSTLRTEVLNTVQRAEAGIATNVMCIADFLRTRLIEDLQALKGQILAAITGQPVLVNRRSAICEVIPPHIDMHLEPQRRNLITFHGYNIAIAPPCKGMRVTVREKRDSGIGEVDVTPHLSCTTPYLMTLNLGANGIQLSDSAYMIAVAYDTGESQIGVAQANNPCRLQEETITIGTRTYRPPHTRGDMEFFGKANISVRTTLDWESDRLIGRIHMKAEQYDDDHTTAEGTDQFEVAYAVPAGWRFDKIVSPSVDEMQYIDRTWEVDVFARGNGLVSRYEFIGDTATEEAGTKTQVTTYFNPLRVRRMEIANCR